MKELFSILDFIIAPTYFAIILFLAHIYQVKKTKENAVYSYYKIGLALKMLGALGLVIIYTQYYKGGDTVNYQRSSKVLTNMLFYKPDVFLNLFSGNLSLENLLAFNDKTGYLTYECRADIRTFTVARNTVPFELIAFQSFLGTTLLIATFSYVGNWKLFLLFTELFPKYHKQFAYAILFVPSVLFWGSGIMKDTFTLSAASWFTYAFYKALIKKEKVLINVLALLFNSWIMITIKPYIFIALMPGTMLWLSFQYIKNIKNTFIRLMFGPTFILIIAGTGALLMQNLSSSFGQYSNTETVLNKAVATQQDLKQAYYGGNSFDIGEFDASISGVLGKFPVATIAGLFRPFIWEAKNPVMLLAGLENSVLLFLTIFLIIKLGPIPFFKVIKSEPILFFSMIFGVFFAFSVGLSTSNFGALVRYKIPAVPYYLASILVLNEHYRTLKKEAEEEREKRNDNRKLIK